MYTLLSSKLRDIFSKYLFYQFREIWHVSRISLSWDSAFFCIAYSSKGIFTGSHLSLNFGNFKWSESWRLYLYCKNQLSLSKCQSKQLLHFLRIKRMDALSRNILCIKTTIGTVKKQGSGNCINLTFYPCCTSGVQSIMRLISSVPVLARNSTIVRVSQEDL